MGWSHGLRQPSRASSVSLERARLILRGTFDVVDDQKIARRFSGFQFEAESLQCRRDIAERINGWLALIRAGVAIRKEPGGTQVQMDVEFSGEAGFVDDVAVQPARQLQTEDGHCLAERIDSGAVDRWPEEAVALAWRLTGRWCGWQLVEVDRDAVLRPRRLKPRAASGYGQKIDGKISAFSVDSELESAFEERLHHGSAHHFV